MQYERIRVRWILTLAARLPEGDRVREAAFDAVLKRHGRRVKRARSRRERVV